MTRTQTLRSIVLIACVLTLPAIHGLRAGADSCPGLWQSWGVPTGTADGISDVTSLPDGTLVAGLRSNGLAFYERNAASGYSWRFETKPARGTGGRRRQQAEG